MMCMSETNSFAGPQAVELESVHQLHIYELRVLTMSRLTLYGTSKRPAIAIANTLLPCFYFINLLRSVSLQLNISHLANPSI
jgi:hypothetical protein